MSEFEIFLTLIWVGCLLLMLFAIPLGLILWYVRRLSRPRPGRYNPATGGWKYDD